MDKYIEEFIYNKAKTTQEHYTSDLNRFRAYLQSQNIAENKFECSFATKHAHKSSIRNGVSFSG